MFAKLWAVWLAKIFIDTWILMINFILYGQAFFGIVKFRLCNIVTTLCDGVRLKGWWSVGVSADPVGHLASQGSDPDLPSYIAQTVYCSTQPSSRQQTISMQTQSRGGYFPHLSSITRKNTPKLPNGNSPFTVWRKPKMS